MEDASRSRIAQTALSGLLLLTLIAAVATLVREPRAAGLAITTLQVAGGAVAIALPLGTILAALVTRTNLPGRRFFIAAWCVLLFLPLYLQASAWDSGFGLQGWFTQWRAVPAARPEVWLAGLSAAIWLHALAAIPWVMLIVGQGLRQAEAELEEQALLDTSPAGVFWNVTLRRALPSILAAGLLVGVVTAGEMTITDIYRVRTYAEELYTNAALTADAVELGLSIWPHIAIVAVLAALAAQAALWLVPIGDRAAPRRLWVFELGALRWPAFGLMQGLTIVALGVPIGNLIYKAGLYIDNSSGYAQQAWSATRFMASTFPDRVNPAQWEFAAEYYATLLIGISAASGAVVIGAALAWAARTGGWKAAPALLLTALGLAVPGPLVALGMIWILNRPSPAILPWLYDKTVFAPAMTIIIRTLPLTTMILWAAIRSIEQDQLDSAAAEGASSWQQWWRVVLPQRWPAVAIAWLMSFAIAAGDLAASILVIPPGRTTIANQIFLLIHAGVHNAEAGLCLGQLALFSTLAVIVLALWKAD